MEDGVDLPRVNLVVNLLASVADVLLSYCGGEDAFEH